jgi:hypothetical protein
MIMTVFTAKPINGDFGRAMLVEDQRNGEIWEETISGWDFIIEVDNRAAPDVSDNCGVRAVSYPCRSYYRHKDGRIATPA